MIYCKEMWEVACVIQIYFHIFFNTVSFNIFKVFSVQFHKFIFHKCLFKGNSKVLFTNKIM